MHFFYFTMSKNANLWMIQTTVTNARKKRVLLTKHCFYFFKIFLLCFFMVHAFLNMSDVRFVHDFFSFSFSVQQWKVQCVSACWMIQCVNVGFIFPWCISHYRRISIVTVWCVWDWRILTCGPAHLLPPTASGLPVQQNKSVRMFSGCRSEMLRVWGLLAWLCLCMHQV